MKCKQCGNRGWFWELVGYSSGIRCTRCNYFEDFEMKKERLEKLAWKAVEFMKHSKKKTYDQLDLMHELDINVLEAIEISEFLVEKGVAKYKGRK